MTGRPLISLTDVKKSYGSFELGPVDLEIEAGYVVAVVGPNGSGKSTLFGMLMGLIHPSFGEVRLFGLSYPKNEVAIKQRIGYVPERAVGHDYMSAKALGEFVSYWYPTWDQRTYDDLVSRSGIDPYKKFGKLSKGMQRRLSFALALAVGPSSCSSTSRPRVWILSPERRCSKTSRASCAMDAVRTGTTVTGRSCSRPTSWRRRGASQTGWSCSRTGSSWAYTTSTNSSTAGRRSG
jgi:ABC-type transport system involved in cytochrome c biogenesis ATPase subunit